jgi:hypothetical protein
MSNTVMAEKMTQALDKKRNDVNNWTWKGPKEYKNGKPEQEEFKMMTATPEQLQHAYAHCNDMLYNEKDKRNPGRYPLLKIIEDQRKRCNAELFIRYLQNPDNGAKPYPIHLFLEDLKTLLNKPETLEVLPRSAWATTSISRAMKVPEDFRTLSIDLVMDACLQNLGMFHKKHITLTFLTKMGLWFTKEEIKEYLTQVDEETGELKDRLQCVKDNLNLRPEVKLYTNFSGLSYLEFRAMYQLHDMRYCEMSLMQLKTLRNKVLFKLEDDVRFHIQTWEEKKAQIEKVCEIRGFRPE